MDVEDHIINGHATHFMAALASVYRKQKNREEAEKLKKEELTPVQDWDEEHRRSEKRTLEQVIQEAKVAREQEAQEQLARERMIKEQAAYLASLKGNNQASSASQILQRCRRISIYILFFLKSSIIILSCPGLPWPRAWVSYQAWRPTYRAPEAVTRWPSRDRGSRGGPAQVHSVTP